jgi:hypothetical protein
VSNSLDCLDRVPREARVRPVFSGILPEKGLFLPRNCLDQRVDPFGGMPDGFRALSAVRGSKAALTCTDAQPRG